MSAWSSLSVKNKPPTMNSSAMLTPRSTDLRSAEIAGALGFEEPSHFNLFFKKHVHYSPSDYRKHVG